MSDTPAAPAAPVIKPTVGRVVLFTMVDRRQLLRLKTEAKWAAEDGVTPKAVVTPTVTRAAVITQVYSDITVALDVLTSPSDALYEHEFGRSGIRQIDSVCLTQDPAGAINAWHWMPFQLGQAGKVTQDLAPLQDAITALTADNVDITATLVSVGEMISKLHQDLVDLGAKVAPLLVPAVPQHAPAAAPAAPSA